MSYGSEPKNNSVSYYPRTDKANPYPLPAPEVPDHYLELGLQPWEAFDRGWLTRAEFIGHLRGTALEYVARAPHKNGADDYRKAIRCLEKLLSLQAEQEQSAP